MNFRPRVTLTAVCGLEVLCLSQAGEGGTKGEGKWPDSMRPGITSVAAKVLSTLPKAAWTTCPDSLTAALGQAELHVLVLTPHRSTSA